MNSVKKLNNLENPVTLSEYCGVISVFIPRYFSDVKLILLYMSGFRSFGHMSGV